MPNLERLRLMSLKKIEGNYDRRDLGSPLGSTGLSLGGLLGVAIAAAVFILIGLLAVFISHARKKDRRERQRIADEIRATEEELNFKVVTTPTRPPEVHRPQKRFNKVVPNLEDEDCVSVKPPQKPATVKTKRGPDNRGLFRVSGMRDSWPLVSNIPLAFLPAQPTMTLNQVAPPGYVVAPDSKWPRRSSTRVSRNRISVPAQESLSESQLMDPLPAMPSPGKQHRKHRSTSETQLSTILRSTSERLKVSQRQSLTRTLTSFTRLPGSPPTERLATPRRRRPNASCEELIHDCYLEPVFSTTRESRCPRTPSPDKHNIEYYTDSPTKLHKSATPSDASDDSLCGTGRQDSAIPRALTSPSKRNKEFQNGHTMSVLPKGGASISMTQRSSCSSPSAHGDQRSSLERQCKFSSPDDIPLSRDPFYSTMQSSRVPFSKSDVMGPRPLRVRKSTLDKGATRERPLSYTLPLGDVSGNAQHPHIRTSSQPNWQTIDNLERNPFQWTPTDIQRSPSQASPRRSGSRRQWHKRSKSKRLSAISRPTSTISVDVVFEESEDDQAPFKFSLVNMPTTHKIIPPKSPTPSPSVTPRRHSLRPPTAATFSPSIDVPTLNTKTADKVEALPLEDALDSMILAASNHYRHTPHSSEESCKRKAPSTLSLKARRHGHNFSAEQTFQPWELEKLIPLLPPIVSPKPTPPRPLSSSKGSPLGLVRSPLVTPAPPLLATPIPGHLTGPRREPPKRSQGPRPAAPRESLHNSISMLRRMNSEISHYSNMSAGTDDKLGRGPKFPFDNSARSSPVETESWQERGRTRGSKFYLSIGQAPPGNSRTRDSHHVYKERQRRRMVQENVSLEANGLVPAPESVDFPPELRALGIVNLSPHKSSSLRNTNLTPPEPENISTPDKEKIRLLAAMNSLPQTPAKSGNRNRRLGSAVLGGEAASASDKRGSAGTIGKHSRPGSLGLYDEAGFLKTSPLKEIRSRG